LQGVTWAVDRMTQPKCPRCLQVVSREDTVVVDGGQLTHRDCRRPRGLSPEEGALLFKYCFDHAVAECASCSQDFRQQELGADLLDNRTNLCPRCRMDLTERLREHLYNCLMLPGEVRRKAWEARAATRRLLKERDQLLDRARSRTSRPRAPTRAGFVAPCSRPERAQRRHAACQQPIISV